MNTVLSRWSRALFSAPLKTASAMTFWVRALRGVIMIRYPRDILVLTQKLVLSTLPVVIAMSFFAGAMLTVQSFSSLSLVGGGPFAGTLVGLGGVREVFPLLAGAGVAARTGAEFAATLGTMRVTEQIDAIDAMGLDPIELLVSPRIWACVLGTPICITVANAIGMFGSFVVGSFQLGVDPGSMKYHLFLSINGHDLEVGLYKGAIVGFVIAIVSTREGYQAAGGAVGVGHSTNKAVVRAMIAVCIVCLAVTYVTYGTRVILWLRHRPSRFGSKTSPCNTGNFVF